MPPQRADAAHIAPYLTHLITHHGQLTLVPPDNNGRQRKGKQNKSRSTRDQPREEPVRFNSGPRLPPSSLGRPSRRSRRPSQTERQYSDGLDDIPDYPPPTFQEAISSCPSTTTLGNITAPHASRHTHNSDSDSESDADSLEIFDAANRGHVPPSPRSQRPRGRGILDSDPDDTGYIPSSSNVRPQRRHLSLSPLRTLFPSRNIRESGLALSAQSTPSPHSLTFSRSSPFFRSTTSLRNLSASTPIQPHSPSCAPSIRSENLLTSRRFFSPKGKERATNEALDSWEIIESERLATPQHPLISSSLNPFHEAPSTPVVPPLNNRPSSPCEPRPPDTVASAPMHPLSERDRLAKSKSRVAPGVSSPARGRERRAPPSAPPPLTIAPDPAVPGSGPPIVTVRTKKPPPPPPPKKKAQPVSSPRATGPASLPELDLERALRIPLPLTPIAGSPISPLSAEPRSPAEENGDVDPHQHQHHYPGRPLPPRPRVIVDSTYAPHPDFPQVILPPQLLTPSVPEGLLIDLGDPEPSSAQVSGPQLAPASSGLDLLRPMAQDMQRTSSGSSVDLAPARAVTDLDILLARLEGDRHDGANYDALLLVSEFIGPASPVRPVGGVSASVSWPSVSKLSTVLSGNIEVQRRRTTKDGRVKLKLALLGIAVDRCGICMTQFKKAESARLSEGCRHAFHERCLGRWVARSRTCPLCRIALDLDVAGCR
ncbi:hypothetical protein C8J57DRAFT_1322957 [Mycena rebaudengoi]|nr:hypothetical protein C8J57DRAFT_1322957 [Mycena rebaudengoi]